jgi:hypothetical protein
VTRWQWARLVDGSAGSLKASPAIDKSGTAYVALNTTLGGLVSVAADGTLGTSTNDGQSDISPAIARNAAGTESVFYESIAGGGTLRATTTSAFCPPIGTTASEGSLAILFDSTDKFMGAGLQGSTGGATRLVGLEGGITCRQGTDYLATVSFPGNFVVNADTIYWGDSNGSLRGAQYVSTPIAGFSPPISNAPSPGGIGTVNGLLLFDGGAGMTIVGGGGPGISKLFAYLVSLATQSPWNSPDAGYPSTPTSGPIATSGSIVAAIRGPTARVEALRVDPALGQRQSLSAEIPGSTFNRPSVPTPVAGAQGLLYFLDQAGYLAVFPQAFTDGSVPLWTAPLPGPLSGALTSSSPTLSCNKRIPTSRTGVLTFATESGWLVTYLVDSKGLDTTAPWPKYGHDIRNTNNPSTLIEACPP